MNLLVQYIIVALLVVAATIWMIIKIRKKGPSSCCEPDAKKSGCSGCALYDNCKKK